MCLIRRTLASAAVLLALIGGAVAPTGAVAQETRIPKLQSYVTDLTGTLSSAEITGLETSLREFDRQTSTQIVVLMVPSLESGAIEDYTYRVAQENGIGSKGRSNGVLLFIAKDDRRIRIEVGAGLEGALTDALSGEIIRREIGPRFTEGNYYAGINAGVQAIMRATKNEYQAEGKGSRQRMVSPFAFLIFFVFLLVRIISRGSRRFRGGGGPFMYGGWGGFSSGGGGFGGGGFGGGGFSGGGGSFNGGGASGGW